MLDELRSRDWVPRSVLRRNARGEVAQAIGQLEQGTWPQRHKLVACAERLRDRYCRLSPNIARLAITASCFSYDEWREKHSDSIELVTDDHQRENPLQQLLDSNHLRQRVMEAITPFAGARKTGINPLLPGRAESQRDWRGAGGRGILGSVSYTARPLNGYALNWVSYNVSKCRTCFDCRGVLNDGRNAPEKGRPLSRYLEL